MISVNWPISASAVVWFRLMLKSPRGQTAIITIRLAGGLGNTPVNITGKAVRHDRDYVAIQFTAIAPDDLHHLQNLIRYNAPDPDQIEDEINSHPGIL